MEFITLVHPGQKDSPKLKRQAHSHAARVAHARARRVRMAHHHASEPGQTPTQLVVGRKNPVLEQTTQVRSRPPTSVPTAIQSAFEHEPLASFLKSLTARERFLFDFYSRVVAPDMREKCPILNILAERNKRIRDNWTLFSSTDVDFLRGSLLSACRWLSMIHMQTEYAEIAIEYKLSLVHDLQAALTTGDLWSSRAAVSKALVVAFDEIMIRDMAMASKHVMGAVQIIQASGGVDVLCLSELVCFMLSSCVYAKRLLDSDPGEVIPCGARCLELIGL